MTLVALPRRIAETPEELAREMEVEEAGRRLRASRLARLDKARGTHREQVDAAREAQRLFPHGAGKEIVHESGKDDPRDPLALDVMGRARTVQLRIPITHIADTKHHLELIAAETLALAAELGRAGEKDQTLLLGVKMRLHRLNQQINAYRGVGRKW